MGSDGVNHGGMMMLTYGYKRGREWFRLPS